MNKRTIILGTLLLLFFTHTVLAETIAVEIRGKILASNGTPITLSPLGGYFGKLSETELVGKMGLQKQYDDELSNGRDVQTFIDEKLQTSIDLLTTKSKNELNATEVLVMVMDSKTGAMVAMSSSNRYDPLYIKMDDIPSLIPKFSAYPYEPGAVMMPFTVAMLLNSHLGERNKYKEWFNTDYDKYQIGENRWVTDDVKKKAQTMSDMLLHSSNIGIAQVAEQVEPEIFSYALDNYGFGHKSGIDLPRDLEGRIKESALFESKMHRANTGYGYGIMATPVQLLKAYSMFANEGWMVTPHIVSSVDMERKEVLAKPIANKLKNMLVRVVKEGTGKKAQVEGLTIGGKTGTAHIAKDGKYSNDYHSSFYGFVEDMQGHSYTIGVLVIEAKVPKAYFASRSAVPVFKSIIESMVEQKLLVPESVKTQTIVKPLRTLLKRLNVTKKHTNVGTYLGAKTRSPLPDAKVVKPFGDVYDARYDIHIFNESVTLQASSSKENVYNVLDGKVVFTGKSKVLGKVVVMSHVNKLHTVYAGLSHLAPSVRVGKRLGKGYIIGKVQDKLIFQVTQEGKFVNPLDLIELEEG